MKFSITDEIPFPLAETFRVHRDHLAELAEYLPTVESIEVESREEDGDVVRLVNLWKGSQAEIPGLARPFIKPHMLSWVDRAEWNEAERTCHWSTELGFLPGAIEAVGHNTFEEEDGVTTVTIEGEIRIHANKIPGIPRLMAKKVGDAVEKFVVKMIEPNLRKTNEGVTRFLEDHGGEI